MLTSSVTGSNHRIFFNDVKLNEGNAYNPNHGVFVAPYNGTYLFTVTACCPGSHYIGLEFRVNNLVYDKIRAGDNAYDECSSKSMFVSLKEKDDVFIQHENHGDYLFASAEKGFPSFGGVLLFAE